MITHVIVAVNSRAAEATAEIDNGWRRLARNRWRLPDGSGDEVRYVDDPSQIMGLRECRLYLGYNWFKSRRAEEIVRLARVYAVCGVEVVEIPWSPLSDRVGQHIWFRPKALDFDCCQTCGVVKRRDGKNKPCRGPVHVGLR